MMLFDNVLTDGEKNRVGRGNHQGLGGNGSRVTPQLSISFSSSVIFVTFWLAQTHSPTLLHNYTQTHS